MTDREEPKHQPAREIGTLDIRPLSPALLEDYLSFFDNDAFADNPRWGFCYCHFLYADQSEKPWEERSADENRSAVRGLIGNCRMQGYLAYVDGRPVGWCNAAPRPLIPALQEDHEPEAERIGSIVCFVIAKPYRGRGIARRLLAAACDRFREQGLAFAEAFPRKDVQSEAANHFGPLSLYLSAGFEIISKDEGGGMVVRKRLAETLLTADEHLSAGW